MLVRPDGDDGVGALDHGKLQIETASPGHHGLAQRGVGQRLPTMVGVQFENGETLEAVSPPIAGQRLQRMRKPAGPDALVKGEVRHEVAFPACGRWSEGADFKIAPELCHGIYVPVDCQVEHGRARPEGGRWSQVHRDGRALGGGGADLCKNRLEAVLADVHRGNERAVWGDALQSLGPERPAQAVDLVGNRSGHHERNRQPASWGHCSAQLGEGLRQRLEHVGGVGRPELDDREPGARLGKRRSSRRRRGWVALEAHVA